MNELPEEILAVIAQRFAALADVNRLRILQRLRRGCATVSELSTELGLSQPNTSAHLSVLRHAGLVAASRVGKNMLYGLSDNTANNLCDAVCASLHEQFHRLYGFLPRESRKLATMKKRTPSPHNKTVIKKEGTRP